LVKKKFEHVYQFKIYLREIEPLIWRRIQVPETYTFWDFHVAIQDSMGWLDYHLHQFRIRNPTTGKMENIGIPDEDEFEDLMNFLPGWEIAIADYFSRDNAMAEYEYDFGDCWEHLIVFEEIAPRLKGKHYPLCIDGERACPPEDCGGTWGYDEFLEAILNPAHEEHESMMVWSGGSYDPERFDPKKVRFDNPLKRWEITFLE